MKKESATAAKPRISLPEPKEAKHRHEQKQPLPIAKELKELYQVI